MAPVGATLQRAQHAAVEGQYRHRGAQHPQRKHAPGHRKALDAIQLPPANDARPGRRGSRQRQGRSDDDSADQRGNITAAVQTRIETQAAQRNLRAQRRGGHAKHCNQRRRPGPAQTHQRDPESDRDADQNAAAPAPQTSQSQACWQRQGVPGGQVQTDRAGIREGQGRHTGGGRAQRGGGRKAPTRQPPLEQDGSRVVDQAASIAKGSAQRGQTQCEVRPRNRSANVRWPAPHSAIWASSRDPTSCRR